MCPKGHGGPGTLRQERMVHPIGCPSGPVRMRGQGNRAQHVLQDVAPRDVGFELYDRAFTVSPKFQSRCRLL
jgi:hypothetical protein